MTLETKIFTFAIAILAYVLGFLRGKGIIRYYSHLLIEIIREKFASIENERFVKNLDEKRIAQMQRELTPLENCIIMPDYRACRKKVVEVLMHDIVQFEGSTKFYWKKDVDEWMRANKA